MSIGAKGYCWPKGFQEDFLYEDTDGPIFWDRDNQNFNADSRMESLRQIIDKLIAEDNTSSDIFLPFGCDFAYNDASQNYQSIDKIIQYWNDLSFKTDQNVFISYSTPHDYLRALRDSNISKDSKGLKV